MSHKGYIARPGNIVIDVNDVVHVANRLLFAVNNPLGERALLLRRVTNDGPSQGHIQLSIRRHASHVLKNQGGVASTVTPLNCSCSTMGGHAAEVVADPSWEGGVKQSIVEPAGNPMNILVRLNDEPGAEHELESCVAVQPGESLAVHLIEGNLPVIGLRLEFVFAPNTLVDGVTPMTATGEEITHLGADLRVSDAAVSAANPVPVSCGPSAFACYIAATANIALTSAADAATGGKLWLVNPVGSSKFVVIVGMTASIAIPDPTSVLATSPRISVERMSFTGTPSSALSPAKSITADADPVAVVATSASGMSITAGNRWSAVYPPAAGQIGVPLAAIGTSSPAIYRVSPKAPLVLAAGEGVVVRQADAGSSGESRLLAVQFEICEVASLDDARAVVRSLL